ncbi:MAG: aldehyde dehydrogenase family protein, partial [Planctomycetes bacterium]|nr:aldehyde dehydrogenase family protein [Planctomycetota bacterium]
MVTASISLLPEVKTFLSQGPLKFHIGGEWVANSSNKTFQTLDPGSGQVLAEVCAGDKSDVDSAVETAKTAFRKSGWATMPVNERCAILQRLADLVENKKPILAQLESLDCGKILANAEGDIDVFINTMRYFVQIAVNASYRNSLAVAEHEAYTSLQPYGPCGFIFPWNFPFLLVGWGISPALAAGNTVVIKPAEDTPLSTLYLCQLAKEAGVPDGVINVVTGFGETAGAAMSENPDIKRMSFTGSPEVGKLVARSCGENLVPVKLELGGKGAAVVFDDVNPEETADKLVQAVTFHTGQVCCTATRWIVHESIFDKVVQRSADQMAEIQIGNPQQDGTQMGPVVNAKQRDRVLGYLKHGKEQGANLVVEGGAANVEGFDGGFYVKPALLRGQPDNVACREEIFGPV